MSLTRFAACIIVLWPGIAHASAWQDINRPMMLQEQLSDPFVAGVRSTPVEGYAESSLSIQCRGTGPLIMIHYAEAIDTADGPIPQVDLTYRIDDGKPVTLKIGRLDNAVAFGTDPDFASPGLARDLLGAHRFYAETFNADGGIVRAQFDFTDPYQVVHKAIRECRL